MTADTRSPAEIESDIERERHRLSDTLDEVQNRFSVEYVARQFTDQFSEHGNEIGRSVSDSVKKNPIALAVTGIGLAWLIFGNGRAQPELGRNDAVKVSHNREADLHLSRGTSTAYAPTQEGQTSGTLRAAGRLPEWAKRAKTISGPQVSRTTDQNSGPGLADKASGGIGAVSDKVKAGRETAADQIQNLRQRLSEGTDNMSESARERIVTAREHAMNAYDQVSNATQRGRSQIGDLYDKQPLLVGALGLAIGAAIGAIAPRTRTEDDLMGEHSDHLFAEAERIYDEEKSKLRDVSKETMAEAKNQVDENIERLGDAAKTSLNQVKSSANEVLETAEAEAKR